MLLTHLLLVLSPLLRLQANFLSAEECAALMEAGRPGLHRSIVVDGVAGKSPAPSRTSTSCYLNKDKCQELLKRVEELLNGKPMAHFEPPQVARYESTQFYLPHYDAFDMTTESGRECAKTGGQRLATVLIYLNTVSDGGCTYFPKLDKRFKPVQGTALIFFPCSLDGKLDEMALHTAEKAVDEKWVSQIWVRERDFK